MSATRSTIDWKGLRERLSRDQMPIQVSGGDDRKRLREVFRDRALRLARRGQRASSHAAKVPVLVFRLAAEQFGIELTHVQQVFPRVSITRVPGMSDTLVGVANLSGTLRSIIDPGPLLNLPAATSEAGYVVLVCAKGQSLGLWAESIEGVRPVDLDSLVSVDEIATKNSADCLRGMTEDRVVVINLEPLFERVRDNVRVNESKHRGIES